MKTQKQQTFLKLNCFSTPISHPTYCPLLNGFFCVSIIFLIVASVGLNYHQFLITC